MKHSLGKTRQTTAEIVERFRKKTPDDHRVSLAERVAEVDLRRQDQIRNQKKIIDRLLESGAYDGLIEGLVKDQVELQAVVRQLEAELQRLKTDQTPPPTAV